jgi:hypothetical protein
LERLSNFRRLDLDMPREVLKLPMAGGEFAVLLDADAAPTCCTDSTGTSRSAIDDTKRHLSTEQQQN